MAWSEVFEKNAALPQSQVIPTRIVKKDSCGPVPAASAGPSSPKVEK